MAKRLLAINRHELLTRQDVPAEPALWEDGIRTDGGPGSFEWWYFDAQFGDRFTAVMVFYTKPMTGQAGGMAPEVSLTITYPDPKDPSKTVVLLETVKYAVSEFKASKEQCDVHIGPSFAHGDFKTYAVHVEANGLVADLMFESISRPWRPDINLLYTDITLAGYYGWLPSVPAANVTGTLTFNGQTQKVTGNGYHDHNWGNRAMNATVARWTWGRAHLGDYTMIFANIEAKPSYDKQVTPVLLLASGTEFLMENGYPLTVTASDYVTDPISKRSYPCNLDLSWQRDDSKITATVRNPQLIEGVSFLIDLPAWQRWLINLVYNPYYFRFQADINVEIDLPGVKTTQTGKTIFEFMLMD